MSTRKLLNSVLTTFKTWRLSSKRSKIVPVGVVEAEEVACSAMPLLGLTRELETPSPTSRRTTKDRVDSGSEV
jgi:hypothetical protein